MKKRYWFLLILILAIIVFYGIPNPVKQFDELFAGDTSVARSLKKVREMPLKSTIINQVEWKYLVAGKGKKTILFLHGMSGAYDIWFQQIESLKNEFRIISVTYPPVSSLKEMGEAINHILTLEETEKVYVVGSSLGGYFTQYLVATYPDRIEKAIFGNTFPPNDLIKEQNGGLAKIIPWLPEWLVMRTFRSNIEEKVVPASGNDELTKAFLLEQNYGLMSKQQFLARFNCVIDHFPPADLHSVAVPVLIIESDNDNVVPAQLIPQMKTTYPQAKVYTFKKAGHFPYLNQPNEYTSLMRDFFSNPREEQLKTDLRNFYFEGRKKARVDLLKQIFNDDSKFVTAANGKEKCGTLKEYLEMVAKQGPVSCSTEILELDITDSVASVKTKFDYGQKVYFDYLSLVQTNGGWRIVNKTYTLVN